MHSPSLIVVNIDTVAWIMREAESDCGSRKSSHLLLSSHRLKKPSFLGYKKYVTLAVGSVSINYGVTCKDWTGMYLPRCRSFFSRTIPPSMIRLEEPERPSHISGIPGCCQNRRTCDRKERFRNTMSINRFTAFVFPFSSEWRDTLSRITYICVSVIWKFGVLF